MGGSESSWNTILREIQDCDDFKQVFDDESNETEYLTLTFESDTGEKREINVEIGTKESKIEENDPVENKVFDDESNETEYLTLTFESDTGEKREINVEIGTKESKIEENDPVENKVVECGSWTKEQNESNKEGNEPNFILHDDNGIFSSSRVKSFPVVKYNLELSRKTSTLSYNNETQIELGLKRTEEIKDISNFYPDDSYLMVSQLHWEDNVIWDANDIKVLKSLHNLTAWVVDSKHRHSTLKTQNIREDQFKKNAWYSIFPIENQELLYGQWENEVIWDAEELPNTLEPKILTLDPNDENIILQIPEDTNHLQENVAPHIGDPFNISNDIFYESHLPETSNKLKIGSGSIIRHATPIVELRAPFIQTHMDPKTLRTFHRPYLKPFTHGNLALKGPHSVKSLSKYIQKKAMEREQASERFCMNTSKDLTSREGELILVEFSEEHPPLINQIGMCSQIKNYYKRTPRKPSGYASYRYGKEACFYTSPFLGVLNPGQSLQAIENNMYRAPIYEHEVPCTDFFIIRNKNHYYIREIDALYCAGQLCPLYEVPEPNSKNATTFLKDFLQVFIYRLLWKSTDNPRRIKMNDILKAFPTISEGSIRSQIRTCTEFKRTTKNSYCWIIKKDFRLPSEDEIREIVSPEQYCAYFSMIAAKQRLKDAGYDEKCLFTPAEGASEEMQLTVADEVKAAPWNTTRAFIRAMEGKCLLNLVGPADPTGRGEGFSYTERKWRQEPQPKLIQISNLQRLTLKDAKVVLKQSGVSEEEIKKLSRWEVIQAVRMLSIDKANSGDNDLETVNIKSSIAYQQNDYKRECQRIFSLQNQILSSAEILTTDEDDSSGSTDIEEMAKNIENVLKTKINSHTKNGKDNVENLKQQKNKDSRKKTEQCLPEITQGKSLVIYRTLKNSEGKEITQIEIVRQTPVINAYLKIRSKNDEELIKPYLTLSKQQIEEIHHERLLIQKQLIRIKPYKSKKVTSAINSSLRHVITKFQKPFKTSRIRNLLSQRKGKPPSSIRIKCSRCGNVGHMKTNRICPLYKKLIPSHNFTTKKIIKDQIKIKNENLINVDHTKKKLSKIVLNQDIEMVPLGERKYDCFINNDYRKPNSGQINRRRKDPVIIFSNILVTILNEMRDMPNAEPFLVPVNKFSSDYHKIIQRPIDLHTIRENLRENKYQNRQEFLVDVNQIVENSKLYNGSQSYLTIAAQNMLYRCITRITEKEESLIQLEKKINPLLDDNALVALAFIFDNIINTKLKPLPQARPFHTPISKTAIFYYDKIKKPMDLDTISKKVSAHTYHNRLEFLEDVEQILKNSEAYNGKGSHFTIDAEFVVNTCRKCLDMYNDHLTHLEEKISLTYKQEELDLSEDSENCVNINSSSESDNKLRKRSKQDVLLSSEDEIKKPRLNDKSAVDFKSEIEIYNDFRLSESDNETVNSDDKDYLGLWF